MCLTPQKLSNAIIPQKTALGHALAPFNDPFSKKSYTYGPIDTKRAFTAPPAPVVTTYSAGQIAEQQKAQKTGQAITPIMSPVGTLDSTPKLKPADPLNPYYGLRVNSSGSGLAS